MVLEPRVIVAWLAVRDKSASSSSLVHRVFNLDAAFLDFIEEQIRWNIAFLQHSSELADCS